MAEQEDTRQTLGQSEAMYRGIVEAGFDVVALVDQSGYVIYVSPQVALLIGYRPEEVIGQPFATFFTASEKDRVAELFALTLHGERLMGLEITVLRKGGAPVLLEVNAFPVWQDSQVARVQVVARDITERRRLEAEVRMLARFPDENPNSVLRISRDYTILYANKASLPLLQQWGRQVGQPLPESYHALLRSVFEAGAVQYVEIDCGGRTISFALAPIAGAGYANLYGRDITERKHHEVERERLLAGVEQEREKVEVLAQALAGERDVLQTTMENTDAMLAYFDTDFNFVTANSAYVKGCGHTLAELIGHSHFTLFPNEENQAIFTRVRDTGEPVSFHDKPFVYADQPWRGVTYWDWTLVPVKDAAGEVQGLVFSLLETTRRVQMEEALRESEAKYRRIVETAREGIWQTDASSRTTFVNRQMADMLGYTVDEMMGRPFYDFIDAAAEAAMRVRATARKQGTGEQYECRLRHKDGSWLWVHVNAAPLLDGTGQLISYLGMMTDISARKQAELDLESYRNYLEDLVKQRTTDLQRTNEALQAEVVRHEQALEQLTVAEGGLRNVISNSLDAMVVLDKQRRVLFVNQAAVALLGRLPTDVVGDTFPFAIPEGHFDEVTIARNEHDVRVAELRVVGIEWEDEVGYLAMLHDVTERRRREDELRALSRRLVAVQEEERRNMARELHDQLGQSLTVLKLQLDRAIVSPESTALTEARSTVSGLIAQVRNLSLDLRPSILDDLGLLPALLWHCERFTNQTKVHVDFHHSGLQRRFPPEVSTTAYRIVQEALTNVARHANVGKASVQVWVEEDTLYIRVMDKGVGFDVTALPVGTSGGLSGMKERAHLLGGQLTIESCPGCTCLTAMLPLDMTKGKGA